MMLTNDFISIVQAEKRPMVLTCVERLRSLFLTVQFVPGGHIVSLFRPGLCEQLDKVEERVFTERPRCSNLLTVNMMVQDGCGKKEKKWISSQIKPRTCSLRLYQG